MIKTFSKNPKLLFLLIYLTISTASAFMGIYIELLPLIPILIILARQNGYGSMFGFALGVLPVYIGWSTATTNPFLAFVFGDGFSNMVVPTNGVLMAMLRIGKISFGKWIRFVLPVFWILIILAIITVIISVKIGYN